MDAPTGPSATLAIDTTPSKAEIAALAGLTFPPNTTRFASVSTLPGLQLDVIFAIPSGEVANFVSASGLATPVADAKVLPHASPLWKPEAEPGTTRSGTERVRDGIRVGLEFINGGATAEPGTTRVRMSISPEGFTTGQATGPSGAPAG